MGKTPCCSHEELKKGAWTVQEDQRLIAYIQKYGTGNWRILPQKAGLQRCGKSCRLRWFNYLRPGIKRGQLSQEEEHTIIRLHAALGNSRWSSIAKHLPMRTDNEIKNYWNSYLKKHLEEKKCLDPLSLKSITTTTSFSSDSEAITTIESSSIDINTIPSKSTSTTTHHSQQGSSKSTSSSSSTNLLNKVARKIVGSGYLDAVKSSSSWQHVNTIDKVTKRVTEYKAGDNSVMQCHSHSSSASARLLNKMATSLSLRVQCHEAARSVFSEFIMGGCEKSETNDQVGNCLLDHAIASTFEDGPHITSAIGSSPSCFSEDNNNNNNNNNNEDDWLCANSISFGNCGGGESSVSEVNLVSSDTGKCYTESSNSTTSCFLDEDVAATTLFDDELIEILRCEDQMNMYII